MPDHEDLTTKSKDAKLPPPEAATEAKSLKDRRIFPDELEAIPSQSLLELVFDGKFGPGWI